MIIDDGSTDETSLVVENIMAVSSIPIRYFFQENKGAAAARNLGVAKARGTYICFLDSDDYFHPLKIERQKQALDESDPSTTVEGYPAPKRAIFLCEKAWTYYLPFKRGQASL